MIKRTILLFVAPEYSSVENRTGSSLLAIEEITMFAK